MTEATINRNLFIDALAHIELDPSTWNQDHWAQIELDDPSAKLPTKIDPLAPACGTAFCFAGWTTVLSGDEMAWKQDKDDPLSYLDTARVVCDGEITSVERAAIKHLGVSNIGELFDGSNTLEVLYQYVANLLAGLDPDDEDAEWAETETLYAEVNARVEVLHEE